MWGDLADGLYHIPTNPPRQAPCAYDGGSNHWISGNLSHAPCHHLEHCPGPWKASPPERIEPDKGTHFQNNPIDTLGPSKTFTYCGRGIKSLQCTEKRFWGKQSGLFLCQAVTNPSMDCFCPRAWVHLVGNVGG